MNLNLKKWIAKVSSCPMVIESGNSGIWKYRKWSDGTAECWGASNNQSYAVTSPYVNGWYATLGTTNFPSGLFTSVESLNATRTQFGSGAALLFISCYAVSTTGFNAYIGSVSSGTYDAQFSYYAIGKWT